MPHFSSLAHWQRATHPLAALGLLLATAGAAQAQTPVAFAPVANYDAGSSPVGINLVDINGDGSVDILAANYGTNKVSVALGNGSGTFGAAATFACGNQPLGLALGDLNGDGKLDAVTANYGGGQIGVLLGTGTGTFGPAAAIACGSSPYGVALGDLNGDGKLDAVTANYGSGQLGVLLGTGTGTFSAVVPYVAGNSPNSLVMADLNGDARLDVVVTNAGGNVNVLLGTGTGAFGAATAFGGGSTASRGGAVGDFNRDGRLDIVVANTNGTVGVLLNKGGGAFGAATTYATGGSGPIGVAVSDLNGDGLLDLAVPNNTSTNLGVLPGTGTGTFGTATTYSAGSNSNPQDAAIGDLNKDNKPDVVVGEGNYTQTMGRIFLNTTLYAAPTLTTLSPTSGPVGSSVTLTGTNLGGATGVKFNGVAATTFAVVNATTLTATVPAGASTGNVTVTTAGGTTAGVAFTVVTDLVVSTTAPIAAGTYNAITVTGTGTGTLAGNVAVSSAVTVQAGGRLNDGCFVLSGPGNFTLAPGGTLGICAAQGLSGSPGVGAIQTTGFRSYSTDATYVYNGTVAQVTGSGLPYQVRALSTTNANEVVLSSPVAVAQTVTVGGAGRLVSNGALTLLSSASGTALVVNAGSGMVSGDATVQRYLDPSLNPGLGYRHYSAPVVNTTVADLTTSGYSPIVNAAYNSAATPGTVRPFPTVFGYDQDRLATVSSSYGAFDKGWVSPTATSNYLGLGYGFAVQIGADQLVDFTGGLVSGSVVLNNLHRGAAASPNATDAGWQLLGNPYPSPIDFSRLVDGTDRVNLDASCYVLESAGPYTGTYRAYVNGLPAGGSLIGTAQGFFVRVSSGQTAGSLTFSNAHRLTTYASQVPVRRTAADPRPLVQLELRGGALADVLYAYAEAGPRPAFDAQYDALKLPNTTGLNLASLAASGESLAIDGRPAFTAATVLPLVVGVPAAGTYALTAAALHNLPAGLDAYLTDAQTGQTLRLVEGQGYSFSVSASQATAALTGRFSLRFSPAGALATTAGFTAAGVSVYPSPAHGSFAMEVPGLAQASTVQAELRNTLGQVVRRQSAALPTAGAHLTMATADLAAGVYTLRLTAGAATLATRVVLN